MSNHRQSNLEDYSNRNKEKFLNKKKHFITMYGGVCECCGESTFEFLSIEHKLGQKGMKKDSSMTAYKKATDKFSPEIYGILCHNCNQATKYGKLCPHKIV